MLMLFFRIIDFFIASFIVSATILGHQFFWVIPNPPLEPLFCPGD